MSDSTAGRSVFDFPVSTRPGGSGVVGGRGKQKTKNRGGPGTQGLSHSLRRGPKGEFWGILEDHAWWTTCMNQLNFQIKCCVPAAACSLATLVATYSAHLRLLFELAGLAPRSHLLSVIVACAILVGSSRSRTNLGVYFCVCSVYGCIGCRDVKR